MQIGTLRAIWRYPIKSLRGEMLDESPVLATGLEGDRVFAIINDSGPRLGKPYRGKEDDRLHRFSPEEAAVLPLDAHFHSDEGGIYFDDAPVSLIVDRWLDGLSSYVGYRVEYERFRPNFYVEADPGVAIDEAMLTGRELRLGGVTLRVRYPIERCVVPTYALDEGAPDPRILRYVAQARSNWMGIYCDVPRAGIARTGDSLELIER